jgi:hypothetical protein
MKIGEKVIVSVVSGVCLILLVAVLKYVLLLPAETLSRDFILYVVIYIVFVSVYAARERTGTRFRHDSPLFWSTLVVLATGAIIMLYAM